MHIQELLTHLKNIGIVIRLNGTGDLAVTAPKGVMTPEIGQQIRDNKQAIVSFLTAGEVKSAARSFPAIQPIEKKGGAVPLSLAQERLWPLAQLLPDTPIYNLAHAFRLQGSLHVAAFERSLHWVIARHEALRTHFERMDEKLTTIITDDLAADLQLVSLEHLKGTEQEARLHQLAHEYSERPFDLASPPLFQAVLFKLSATEHVFLFVVHHIIFDGWSLDVFMDDLAFAYQSPEPEVANPPLPIQYSDFAAWQRDWLNSAAAKAGLEFWQATLQEPVEALQLPVAHQVSSNNSFYEIQQQQIVIPPALTKSIKAVVQRTKSSLFMVLLAAYKATLFAYTGQKDMLVCSPTAGRLVADLEELIGYFNSVVVFRSQLGEDLTFEALIAQEKQVVLAANEQQATPFQSVAELPSVSNFSLMRTMFIVQNRVKPAPSFSEIVVSPVSMEGKYGYADNFIELTEKDGEITGSLWFKTALFEAAHMAQFVADYVSVLSMMAANLERPLSSLPRFEMPVVGDEVERGTGKEEKRPFTPPRDKLEMELAAIWGDLLSYEPVSVYDDFFEVGGHSLLAVRLFDQFASATDKKLPLSLLFQAPTIASLAEFVRDGSAEVRVSSVVRLTGHDVNLAAAEKRPFYCVTPPGDELLVFKGLAEAMGDKRPFIGLQYGVNGEPPILSVEAMAAYFIEEILSQDTHEPYLLGGYCFGGLLAYEMARQLKNQNKDVALVTLIDTAVADAAVPKPIKQNSFKNNLTLLQELGIESYTKHLASQMQYRWNEGIGYSRWQKMQQQYEEQNKPLPEALHNYFFINKYAASHYQVKPYTGNMLLIQPEVRDPAFEYEPYLGWERFITGTIIERFVPGTHRSILDEPYVEELAATVQEGVEKVAAKSS